MSLNIGDSQRNIHISSEHHKTGFSLIVTIVEGDCLSLSVQYQIFTQVIVLMCVVFVIDQTHVHTNDCLFISTVSDLHSGYSADVCSVCYRSDTRSH